VTGTNTPRYAYFGTGLFAARCLEILSSWNAPSWAVTSLPARSGRGRGLLRTPVAELASVTLGVPLIETSGASSDAAVLDCLKNSPIDFAFVVDFGQFIKEPILSAGRIGCLNIHPSLLPRYRGAAPLQRALMDGAAETGVTLFKLEHGIDSGPVLISERVPITPDDDYGSLREKTAVIGAESFIKLASREAPENWKFTPQDSSLATPAPKISRDEERIDWRRPASDIVNLVRALSPKPGAWTTIRGKRLIILSAAISGRRGGAVPGELIPGAEFSVASGDGLVTLVAVQPDGKKPQSAAAWRNGLRVGAEERLT